MTKRRSAIKYVAPSESFWEIPGVVYRGETGTYRLFEAMTQPMTQNELSELYEREKKAGNPHPADSILNFAIPLVAYNLRKKNPEEAEELRNFLQTSFRKYPNTLTRVIYSPSGNDRIIHNYGTSEQYSVDKKVVGKSDWLVNIPDKRVLEALLGTKNVPQINRLFQWVNGTDAYIWRLDSKPKQEEERVAWFGAIVSRLSLTCGRNPLDEYPAFRVLRVD